MNRKLLENNITEIKFPSTVDQEWSLLDFPSMGGDSNNFRFQPGSSQNTVALWLEEKDIYDPDFFGDSNWSEATGRTVSSCSWGDDEFERESTNKVQTLLDAVDEAIYEGNNQTVLDEEVLEECQEWARKYTYLRLKGKSVADCFDSEIVPCQTGSESTSQPCEESSKQLATDSGIVVSSESIAEASSLLTEDDNYLFTNDSSEEVIAQDGLYKECMDFPNIFDKGNRCVDSSQAVSKINPSIVNNLKESIIERLVNDVWPEVLSLVRETKGKSVASKHEVLLPPIAVASECRTPMSRPGTEERSRIDSPDFPSLDGILTVSSKILQKRREHKTGSELGIKNNLDSDAHRPYGTSEINASVYKDNSFRISSHFVDAFNVQEHSKLFKLPHQKLDYDSHEEDYHSLPDIVRGIHIEPEAKDSMCKCRANENSNSSPRPMSFLPPIDDTENFSSQQQDIFIESPSPYQVSKFEYHSLERNASRNGSRPNTSSTSKNQRHTLPSRSPSLYETSKVDYHLGKSINRNCSRPNTGMTSRSIPDLVKRKKSIAADGLSQYNGFRPKVNVLKSPSQRNILSQQHAMNKHGPNVWSSEKPVTLFPLVTSLEPENFSTNQRGKNQQNIKKGGFLGSVASERSKR